jgi:hypothetical protein
VAGALGFGGEKAAAPAIGPLVTPTPTPAPSTQPFDRAAAGEGQVPNAVQLLVMAATVMGRLGEFVRPEQVPWYVVYAMGYDPWLYLGEEFFAAPLRDPTLYYLEHKDEAVKAEAAEWLKPIMGELLDVGTRSIAWGCMPFVLDWRAEDLVVEVNGRNRNLIGHQHVVGPVHDLFPGDVETWRAKGDRLEWLKYSGSAYLGEAAQTPGAVTRAFWPVWRKMFGDFAGMGSRRRAYAPWYRGEMDACRQDRYLDRSVDPPRVAYGPNGTMELNGRTVRCIDVMGSAITALKGGGTAVFPANLTKDGKDREWAVAAMQLPNVSDVWHKRMDQLAAEKLVASLVPPSAAGMGARTFAGAKVPQDLFVEVLRSAAEWCAAVIVQPVVDAVHFVNHGTKTKPPRACAREIPAVKVKRLTELFKTVAAQPRRVPGEKGEDGEEGEDREVTLAELIDESIIDDLGVERRPTEEAAREKRGPVAPGGPGGRALELDSDREERREGSPTDEGEDDTGGDDTDRQERE